MKCLRNNFLTVITFVLMVSISQLSLAQNSQKSDEINRHISLPDFTVSTHRLVDNKVISTILNKGEVAPNLRPTVTLYVYREGQATVTEDQTVPALGASETFTLRFNTLVLDGSKYQIMIDSKREVLESNENNNRTLNATQAEQTQVRRHDPVIDPRLSRYASIYNQEIALDGSPRPIAVARFPTGDTIAFAESELMITTNDPSQVEALVRKYNGVITGRISRPKDSDRGSTYSIRFDTKLAPANSFTAKEKGFTFSSEASHSLLIIAATENALGNKLGVIPMLNSDSLLTGKTTEANNLDALAKGYTQDALAQDYMRSGGPIDVDVAWAWKALTVAGKTKSRNVIIGIIDGGFGIGQSGFSEQDIDVAYSFEASGINRMGCKSVCNYHGIMVAEAAAGIADDGRGFAGTGGPVARIAAIDRGPSGFDRAVSALWRAHNSGAQIINMSFGAKMPRNTGWFEGAWSNSLQDFEADTRDLATKYNRLLFASAGNDSFDIDSKNSDGDEAYWVYPCENQGVRCVGGWETDPKKVGYVTKAQFDSPGSGSNFSNVLSGETVDIWGPYCVWVGDTPENPGANVVEKVCGTSFSSPMVAGVAALVWAGNPNLSASQVWDILISNAKIDGYTSPRVHAREAVRASIKSSGINTNPVIKITSPINGGTISPGTMINFNADSFDVEDKVCCSRQWSVNGKPINGDFKWKGQTLGTQAVSVTVTDSQGGTATDSVKINLVNSAPKLKIIPISSGGIYKGLPYKFRSEVMDDEANLSGLPDGNACKKVVWSVEPSSAKIESSDGCAVTVIFEDVTVYNLSAQYTDFYGMVSSDKISYSAIGTNGLIGNITSPLNENAFSFDQFIPVDVVARNVVNRRTIVDPLTGKIKNSIGPGVTFKSDWTLTHIKSNVKKSINLIKKGNELGFTLSQLYPEYNWSVSGEKYKLTVVLKTDTGQTSDPINVNINQIPTPK
jgi:serine protease